jgi:hypothetical protein
VRTVLALAPGFNLAGYPQHTRQLLLHVLKVLVAEPVYADQGTALGVTCTRAQSPCRVSNLSTFHTNVLWREIRCQ